jgi:hypothetical protein
MPGLSGTGQYAMRQGWRNSDRGTVADVSDVILPDWKFCDPVNG